MTYDEDEIFTGLRAFLVDCFKNADGEMKRGSKRRREYWRGRKTGFAEAVLLLDKAITVCNNITPEIECGG